MLVTAPWRARPDLQSGTGSPAPGVAVVVAIP